MYTYTLDIARSLPRYISIALSFGVILLAGCGGGGGSSSGSGNPPVANSGVLSVVAGIASNGTLNASDPDGDPLTYSISANGNLGAVTSLNATTGEYTYTPNANVTGSDTFTFRVNDGALDSNLATVTVQIIVPQNNPPIAVNDSYNVNEGALLTINVTSGVLANDADSANDPLTAILVQGPANAAAFSLNPDGSFSYTHDGSETTTDGFTYQANDGALDSSVATVVITVNPINDAPVAGNNNYNVDEGALLTVNVASGVLSNDTDSDSASLTAILVQGPVNAAAFSLNPDGSFSYTHDGSETTADSFTYQANDGVLDSNVATVAITVNPVNDAPVAVDDNPPYTVTVGDILTVNTTSGVLANDTDGENDPLNAVLVTGPTDAAAFSLNSDGSFTYTHNGIGVSDDTFTYRANDGTSNSTVATVTITLNMPPVASAGCSNTPQAVVQPMLGTLSAADVDSPLLTFMLGADGSSGNGPLITAKGQVVITDNTTGDFEYTPNSAGARGSDSFTYRVEDPDGGFDTATETVIIDQQIMPLGDSITQGLIDSIPDTPLLASRVGYRKTLYDSLLATGYVVDFVGSQSAGGSLLSDADHEGYPGLLDEEIVSGPTLSGYPTDGVRAWLDQNPADIILLHIGTNGLHTQALHVQSILDEIDVWEASPNGNPVRVILARIIDQNPGDPGVTTFNDNVATMVLGRPLDNVVIVNQQSALWDLSNLPDPTLYGDQWHPNATGYDKMAVVWENELVNVLNKCP